MKSDRNYPVILTVQKRLLLFQESSKFQVSWRENAATCSKDNHQAIPQLLCFVGHTVYMCGCHVYVSPKKSSTVRPLAIENFDNCPDSFKYSVIIFQDSGPHSFSLEEMRCLLLFNKMVLNMIALGQAEIMVILS